MQQSAFLCETYLTWEVDSDIINSMWTSELRGKWAFCVLASIDESLDHVYQFQPSQSNVAVFSVVLLFFLWMHVKDLKK